MSYSIVISGEAGPDDEAAHLEYLRNAVLGLPGVSVAEASTEHNGHVNLLNPPAQPAVDQGQDDGQEDEHPAPETDQE